MQLDYPSLKVYCDRCGNHIYPQDGFGVMFYPERYYHLPCLQEVLFLDGWLVPRKTTQGE